MKERITRIAIYIVLIAIVFVGLVVPAILYNDGVCSKCGIAYEENRCVYNANSYTKFVCENCGRWGIVIDWLK